MLRFTSKIEQATAEAREQGIEQGKEQGIKQGKEQGREEGIAEGRVEVYRAWADWNKRREEAAAKGIPFDEPPPPNPENVTEEQQGKP